MATAKNTTPLMSVLRSFESDAERQRFAELAGTTVNYLYALAGCHRGQRGPSAALAIGIEDASVIVNRETRGRIPIVTVREIASMCAIAGLPSSAG